MIENNLFVQYVYPNGAKVAPVGTFTEVTECNEAIEKFAKRRGITMECHNCIPHGYAWWGKTLSGLSCRFEVTTIK